MAFYTPVIDGLAQASAIRWDSVYRFIASLVGMASVADAVPGFQVTKPSDAFIKAADWAGLSVDRQIQDASRWLSDPTRAGAIGGSACIVLVLALFSVAAYAKGSSNELSAGAWRASATCWLALALILQTGSPGRGWLIAIGVSIVGWAVWKYCDGKRVALPAAVFEIVGALLLAIVLPVFWSLSGSD